MSEPLSELDRIARQIKSMERRKKPKMLVVDDEPDNLDLLYRTFRRDFRVFKADSGVSALDVLSEEGEVAVIISDQRMPEMKGTEFLSQTVPQFPDTVRIILTGFTDVEDLVEAINSGQVYKYITKPWDPNELKVVVDKAAETYDILKQRTAELIRAHEQATLLATISDIVQEHDSPAACLEPIASALGESFVATGCTLQLVTDGQLAAAGQYFAGEPVALDLSADGLVKETLANRETHIWLSGSKDAQPEGADTYRELGLQMYLVIPLLYRDRLIALLALQWQTTNPASEGELQLIHLAAQQVTLALTAVQVA
ncbi:MAG: response regulator [Spirulinaceae cyanobacterium SM2_1_0]|nr:response regulator [Spirulinaceae cyanobacterium SM2_1_0]